MKKNKNFVKNEKIENLVKALNDIGVSTTVDYNAVWYCSDKKTHYGIEVTTNIDYGEDYLSFCFTPNENYITDCIYAPIKKQKEVYLLFLFRRSTSKARKVVEC